MVQRPPGGWGGCAQAARAVVQVLPVNIKTQSNKYVPMEAAEAGGDWKEVDVRYSWSHRRDPAAPYAPSHASVVKTPGRVGVRRSQMSCD